MSLAGRWMEILDAADAELAEPDPVTDMDQPNWRGHPLRFSDWILEDPAGTAIVFFAVVDAPDARKANWRMN